MVVDTVSDISTLSEDQVKAPPQMGTALNADNLAGLGTLPERMLIFMDIENLMSSMDIGTEIDHKMAA